MSELYHVLAQVLVYLVLGLFAFFAICYLAYAVAKMSTLGYLRALALYRDMERRRAGGDEGLEWKGKAPAPRE